MKLNNILNTFYLLLILLLLSSHLRANDDVIQNITIGAPISAPFVFKNVQGESQGFLVELFNLVEQETDLKATIIIMPWSRAMHEVKMGNINALMPTIYTDERAQFLMYPRLPLIEFNTVLLKRTQDNIVIDDLTLLGTEKVIVKIRGMSMGKAFDEAEKAEQINVVEVRDFDHAIKMLAQSRVDLVACVDYIANSSLKRLNLQDQIDILTFSDKKTLAYLVFSQAYADKNDINELMGKINEVKKTPQFRALVDKFLKRKADERLIHSSIN